MFKKGNKGITLIALIITIIVLLILAGVTIAQITGKDSAPQKAADAKLENEKGAAKDEATMLAAQYVQEYMEKKYVQNIRVEEKTSSVQDKKLKVGQDGNSVYKVSGVELPKMLADGEETIPAIVGDYVAQQFSSRASQEGSYNYSTSGRSLTVKTKENEDLVSGTIQDDGVITWDETESGGQHGENTVGPTIVGNVKPQIGDSVYYRPEGGTPENIELPEGTTVIGGNVHTVQAQDWKILNVTEDGDILIIPTRGLLNRLKVDGTEASWNNLADALNIVSSIYGDSEYAKSARSINFEDLCNAAKISVPKKEKVTLSWNSSYGVDENQNIVDFGSRPSTIAVATIRDGVEVVVDIPDGGTVANEEETSFTGYNMEDGEIISEVGEAIENTFYEKLLLYITGTDNSDGYWISYDNVVVQPGSWHKQKMIGQRSYRWGLGLSPYTYAFIEEGNGAGHLSGLRALVFPVVLLSDDITMEKDGNGVWQLSVE